MIEALISKIETVAGAGLDWIQIREKDLPGGALARLTREALDRVSKRVDPARVPARIFVNDRMDAAFSERSGGVHLGENSLPVEQVKRWMRTSPAVQQDFLVGVSCHSLASAKSAATAGADYLFFGPVFATPSKASYGAPQGLLALSEICASVEIPVLAIGGITLKNASSCLSAGASGIAAIRLFQDAADPATIVRSMRRQLSG